MDENIWSQTGIKITFCMDINELETNFGVRQLLTNIVINLSQNFLWLIINFQLIYDRLEFYNYFSYGYKLL